MTDSPTKPVAPLSEEKLITMNTDERDERLRQIQTMQVERYLSGDLSPREVNMRDDIHVLLDCLEGGVLVNREDAARIAERPRIQDAMRGIVDTTADAHLIAADIRAMKPFVSSGDARLERVQAQLDGILNCLACSQIEVESLRDAATRMRDLCVEKVRAQAELCRYGYHDARNELLDVAGQIEREYSVVASRASVPAVEGDARHVWATVFDIVSANCHLISRDVIKQFEAARDKGSIAPPAAVSSSSPAEPPTTHPFGPCGYRYCDWPDGELRCNEPRWPNTAAPLQPESEQVCKCGSPKNDPIHSYATEWQQMHTFTPKAVPVGQAPEALKRASKLCRSVIPGARVELIFQNLKDAQVVHRWLCNAAATPSPVRVNSVMSGGKEAIEWQRKESEKLNSGPPVDELSRARQDSEASSVTPSSQESVSERQSGPVPTPSPVSEPQLTEDESQLVIGAIPLQALPETPVEECSSKFCMDGWVDKAYSSPDGSENWVDQVPCQTCRVHCDPDEDAAPVVSDGDDEGDKS